jgi:hypothetical protein
MRADAAVEADIDAAEAIDAVVVDAAVFAGGVTGAGQA